MKKLIVVFAAYLFLAFGLGGIVRADECGGMNMMPGKAMVEMAMDDAPGSDSSSPDCEKSMSQVRCVASCAVPAPSSTSVFASFVGLRLSYKPAIFSALADTLAPPDPFPPRSIA
ncbi:hypothetical protein N185_15770 [Sinorhizobium sp. GW3]|nr:hypothetical protein N185_15770 [Sinorhizobium sp. GW3]